MLIRSIGALLLLSSANAYAEFDRHIKLEGEDNMRDMGGFVTTDSRRVSQGKLFRSGQLDELSDSDVQKLAELGIEHVVDLRSDGELEAHPSRLPEDVATHHLSLSWNTGPEEQRRSLDDVMSGKISGRDLLSGAYSEIGEGKIQSWTEFFNVLETGDTTLWHCAGGRDRAGMTAALTLLALGVDKQTALEDHVASNQYLHEMNEAMRAQVRAEYGEEGVAHIDEVLILDPWMMQSFYDTVDRQFGSMDAFFEVLDVDRAALRQHYLEPN
jgi:protein-tyrosine phosphatase